MVFQVYRNFQRNSVSRHSRSSHSSTSMLSRVLELLLHVFVIGLAAAIIGTASHIWQSYDQGMNENSLLWLALWPDVVSWQTIRVLIGTASAILLLNLLAIILSFIPKLNHKSHPKLSALCLIAFSTLSCLVAIIALALSSYNESRRGDRDTLKSWTCRFGDSIEHFRTLCTESHFAYYAMIPILVMDVILVLLGIGRLFASKRAATTHVTADKSSDY